MTFYYYICHEKLCFMLFFLKKYLFIAVLIDWLTFVLYQINFGFGLQELNLKPLYLFSSYKF